MSILPVIVELIGQTGVSDLPKESNKKGRIRAPFFFAMCRAKLRNTLRKK
jgi:hypothetical protein